MSQWCEDGQGFDLPPGVGTLGSSSTLTCQALPSHHALKLDFVVILSLVCEFLISLIYANVCKPSCIWVCIIKLGNKDRTFAPKRISIKQWFQLFGPLLGNPNY